MRLALIADIHGNALALEAVIADLAETAPDLVVNLGDCLSGPLLPAETADQLIDLGWVTVRGNHDRHLLEQAAEAMGPSDRFAHDRIDDGHRDWLSTLPASLRVEGEILLCHGTPTSDDSYLVETVTALGPIGAGGDEIDRRLGGIMATVIACGHSHRPGFYRLPTGRTVINPGSVGLPAYRDETPVPHVMAVGSPHARYAIMERGRDGEWCATFRVLEYDWDKAAALARRAGRLDWAEALATGWIAG